MKISELSSAGTVTTASDLLVLVQSSSTKKITVQSLFNSLLSQANTFTGFPQDFTGGTGGNYAVRVLANSGAAARNIALFGHLGVSNGVVITSDGTTVTETINGNLSLTGTLNGVATTDFARLSQTSVFTGAAVELATTNPWLRWYESDGVSNEKYWSFEANDGAFSGRAYSDDLGSQSPWVIVDRSGTTIDSIALTATAITLSGGVTIDGDVAIKSGSTTRFSVTTSGTWTMNTGLAASASAGAATLPSNPVGFLEVVIGGTIRKVPYYAL